MTSIRDSSGEEDDDQLVFKDVYTDYDYDIDCSGTSITQTEIAPEGDSFTGEIRLSVNISCGDGSKDSCATAYDVDGKKN